MKNIHAFSLTLRENEKSGATGSTTNNFFNQGKVIFTEILKDVSLPLPIRNAYLLGLVFMIGNDIENAQVLVVKERVYDQAGG